MTALLAIATVLAVTGWFAFWCAEDKIKTLETARRDVLRLAARTELDNQRLRVTIARITGHPSTGNDTAAGFVRTLAAVRALPELDQPS